MLGLPHSYRCPSTQLQSISFKTSSLTLRLQEPSQQSIFVSDFSMVWCPKAISLWFLTTKTTPNSFPRYNFPLIFLWFNSDFHCKCTPDFSLISHFWKPQFLSKFLLRNERIFLWKVGFLFLHFFLRIFVWFFFAWQSISFYFILCVLHISIILFNC